MSVLEFYIIGFIISYLLLKLFRYYNRHEFYTDWGIIFKCIFISFFSWLSIFLITIALIFWFLKIISKKKPPKFL